MRTRLLASPLANTLALDAAILVVCAAVLRAPGAVLWLSTEPNGRVVGLAVVGCGWFTARVVVRTATGFRRALAFVAAVLTTLVGVLRGSGPGVVDALASQNLWRPDSGVLEGAVASLCAAAAVWAWITSPATRR